MCVSEPFFFLEKFSKTQFLAEERIFSIFFSFFGSLTQVLKDPKCHENFSKDGVLCSRRLCVSEFRFGMDFLKSWFLWRRSMFSDFFPRFWIH